MPSSIPATQTSIPRVATPPPDLLIIDWPLKDQPITASLALALAAGAAWLAVWATNNPAAGALVAVALAITLWRTWLPVHFRIGPEGIVQTVLGWRLRIPWTAVRHCDLRSDGVLLLADDYPTPAAPLRGLYLHWGNHRDALLAHLDYHLPGRQRFAEASGGRKSPGNSAPLES